MSDLSQPDGPAPTQPDLPAPSPEPVVPPPVPPGLPSNDEPAGIPPGSPSEVPGQSEPLDVPPLMPDEVSDIPRLKSAERGAYALPSRPVWPIRRLRRLITPRALDRCSFQEISGEQGLAAGDRLASPLALPLLPACP